MSKERSLRGLHVLPEILDQRGSRMSSRGDR